MPLLLPALLSGALIVFVTSAGVFDVPLSISATKGIRMVPTEIYRAVQYPSDFGRASAFAVVMMTVTIVLVILQRRWVNKRRFDTVSGKGYRPRRSGCICRPGAPRSTLEIVYFAGGVVLPIMALLMVSLSPLWTGVSARQRRPEQFPIRAVEYWLTQQAIHNSLFLAMVGATLGVMHGALQAYYIRRGPSRGRRLVDPVLSLPLGIPGIIIGLGFLILVIRTPLYSTLRSS